MTSANEPRKSSFLNIGFVLMQAHLELIEDQIQTADAVWVVETGRDGFEESLATNDLGGVRGNPHQGRSICSRICELRFPSGSSSHACGFSVCGKTTMPSPGNPQHSRLRFASWFMAWATPALRNDVLPTPATPWRIVSR